MYYRKKETDAGFKQASNVGEREAAAERMKQVGKQAAAKRRIGGAVVHSNPAK